VLNSIEENRPLKSFSMPEITTIKLHGTVLDVKVASLPNIDRDLTDRNRTSPFAFTGNKFEFRAVGSKQSPSFPVTLLNSAVADAVRQITTDLRTEKGSKPFLSDADKISVIRKYIKLSKPIRFEGDNYSQAWADEAANRGLPNIKDAPSAFAFLLQHEHQHMLTKGIFSHEEIESRYNILMEKYVKDIRIEGSTLLSMVKQQVIPAVLSYRGDVARSLAALNTAGIDVGPEKYALDETSPLLTKLQHQATELEHLLHKAEQEEHSLPDEAKFCSKQLVPLMERLREVADKLEHVTGDKYWPFPKFNELLL